MTNSTFVAATAGRLSSATALYGSECSYNGLYLAGAEFADGTRRSTLAELTSWTQWADKVIVF